MILPIKKLQHFSINAIKFLNISFLFLVLVMLFLGCNESDRERRVLVFSKTEGFRHGSIPAGITAIKKLGRENGFKVFPTEDATLFQEKYLKNFSLFR